jgi:hypothetical protein
MKYWVYKDSQILGPLAKEDLGQAGGVRPETLVCAEDSAGRMDADWRCAEEVGELSGLCAAAPPRLGAESFLEPGFGLLERLRFETLALPGEGDGDGWLRDLFSPAADLPRPDEAARQELKDSKDRIQELTSQIELLTQRLSEAQPLPRQDQPAPRQAFAAPPAAPPPLSGPPPVLAPLPKVDVPAPQDIKPPMQEGPSLAPEESPYQWETPTAPAGLPQIGSAPADFQQPPAPAAFPQPLAQAAAPETADAPPPAPPAAAKGRPRRVVKVSAPRSLHKVQKAAGPALPPALKAPAPTPAAPTPPPAVAPTLTPEASPYQWGPQPSPAGSLPLAGVAPLPAAPLAPSAPAPIELSAPPATIVPGAFIPPMSSAAQPVLPPPPAFSAAPPTLEAPPVPTFSPSLPTPAALPPMTMAFSGASAMPLPTAGPAVMALPPAGPSTQEVLAKLAKPVPAKTEPPKPRQGRAKPFLIGIGIASVVVVAAAWFFLFRDSKGLKTALQMDSGRSPVGAEMSAEESAGAAKPKPAAPAPQSASQPAPAPQAAASQPQAPAAPAEEIRDERPAAIDLVKEYPLDGDRGTVGQWLQYSFAASPGAQSEEKWDAGAYEESTYAVKYTVQPAGKDAITYLFEADVARKTVKGMNTAARELLAGRSPAPGKPAAKARPAKARPAAPKKRTPPKHSAAPAAAPAPKAVPLLPLPSDEELTPPAEDESSFRSDTVQPNL